VSVRLGSEERERVFAAVADERRSIAALINGLDAGELATASLCTGWDVKTVAAHLVSDFTDGFWGFLVSGVRHGSINRGIDALARRHAQAAATEIADALRRGADHELSPPVTGPLSGLTDVVVHGADMPAALPARDPSRLHRHGRRVAGRSDDAGLAPLDRACAPGLALAARRGDQLRHPRSSGKTGRSSTASSPCS
jgi:uncharacterized protein (TIGR03083 family)